MSTYLHETFESGRLLRAIDVNLELRVAAKHFSALFLRTLRSPDSWLVLSNVMLQSNEVNTYSPDSQMKDFNVSSNETFCLADILYRRLEAVLGVYADPSFLLRIRAPLNGVVFFPGVIIDNNSLILFLTSPR